MPLLDAPQVGDDAGLRKLLRRLADLETLLQQATAAAAGIGAIQTQVAFLAGQTVSAEAAPGALTTRTTNPATVDVADTWLAFDAAADASCSLTTSSTGRLAVQAGGYLWLAASNFCTARGYIGVEILDSLGVVVRNPGSGDGNYSTIWGANNSNVFVGSGHRHEWLMTPNTLYTLRCRRGYSVGAGSAGAVATTAFQGTAISVTKLGM